MTSLRFDFTATECNGWPWLQVLIDHKVVDKLHVTSEKISLDVLMPVQPGQHLLQFERINKTVDNTKVDAQGHIIKDQTVCLENIWYDNVKLPRNFLWQGIFVYDDILLPQSLTWGPNGMWSWTFETPVLPWIISIKNQQRSNVTELFVPTKDRVCEFAQKIQKISHDLNGI